MHQTKKGNQCYFGMKAHIGVDEHSGLVHHSHCTAANVADVTQVQHMLHGREEEIYGDSGYTDAEHRAELQDIKAAFLIAEKPSKLRAIKNKRNLKHARRWEHFKASVRDGKYRPTVQKYRWDLRLLTDSRKRRRKCRRSSV